MGGPGSCIWTLDPQHVVLFWEVVEPFGHGAYLEDLGLWGQALKVHSLALCLPSFSHEPSMVSKPATATGRAASTTTPSLHDNWALHNREPRQSTPSWCCFGRCLVTARRKGKWYLKACHFSSTAPESVIMFRDIMEQEEALHWECPFGGFQALHLLPINWWWFLHDYLVYDPVMKLLHFEVQNKFETLALHSLQENNKVL